MHRYGRERKLFLVALVGCSIGGCTTPQRFQRGLPDVETSSRDRVAAKVTVATDQRGAIDGNLLESSFPSSGAGVIPVGHRLGSQIVTTVATEIPAIAIVPDPATPESM